MCSNGRIFRFDFRRARVCVFVFMCTVCVFVCACSPRYSLSAIFFQIFHNGFLGWLVMRSEGGEGVGCDGVTDDCVDVDFRLFALVCCGSSTHKHALYLTYTHTFSLSFHLPVTPNPQCSSQRSVLSERNCLRLRLLVPLFYGSTTLLSS